MASYTFCGNPVSRSLTGCNCLNIGDILMLEKGKWSSQWYILHMLTKVGYNADMYVKKSTTVTHSGAMLTKYLRIHILLDSILTVSSFGDLVLWLLIPEYVAYLQHNCGSMLPSQTL